MRLSIEAEGISPTALATAILGAVVGALAATFVHYRYQEIAAADFAERLAFEAAYADDDDDE